MARKEKAQRPLESLSSETLLGKNVVYFENQGFTALVYVGRIEEVHPHSLADLVDQGLIAEMVLLEADGHEYLADLFYQSYLYLNPTPPAAGLCYRWPNDLPPQTFKKPKRPGHSIHITLKTSVSITIAFSVDGESHAE